MSNITRIGPFLVARDAVGVTARTEFRRWRAALVVVGFASGGGWLAFTHYVLQTDEPVVTGLAVAPPAILTAVAFLGGRALGGFGLQARLGSDGKLQIQGPGGEQCLPLDQLRGFRTRQTELTSPRGRTHRFYAPVLDTDAGELEILAGPGVSKPISDALCQCFNAWILSQGSYESPERGQLAKQELYAVVGLLLFVALCVAVLVWTLP